MPTFSASNVYGNATVASHSNRDDKVEHEFTELT